MPRRIAQHLTRLCRWPINALVVGQLFSNRIDVDIGVSQLSRGLTPGHPWHTPYSLPGGDFDDQHKMDERTYSTVVKLLLYLGIDRLYQVISFSYTLRPRACNFLKGREP